jgi:DNA anti-recombination protein RmuC
VLLLAIVGILIYVFFLKKEEKKPEQTDGLLMLQKQLQDLTKTMNERMGETNKVMQEGARAQFRESRELIQEINREVNEQLRNVVKGVTEVSESSKQVFSVAEQLQSLEKVLKHQKQRGNLGEASLQLALENMFSPQEKSFNISFQEGRPWTQSSLRRMASFRLMQSSHSIIIDVWSMRLTR